MEIKHIFMWKILHEESCFDTDAQGNSEMDGLIVVKYKNISI